jgi:4-hydroxy-4-methyl-2-oxoglutarate aldolase
VFAAESADGDTDGALRTALVSDVLDARGLRSQTLAAGLAALLPGGRLVGRAFPVTAVPVEQLPEQRYVGLLDALDHIGPGEVFVLATGGSDTAAGWGELLSAACVSAQAVGAVVDAPIRDAELIAAMGFPVFGRGTLPSDCHGRLEVTVHGQPVQIGGVTIARGDVVVADADGVVVVPAALAEEVLSEAAAKAGREDLFRGAVANGVKPSEAFRQYGVL